MCGYAILTPNSTTFPINPTQCEYSLHNSKLIEQQLGIITDVSELQTDNTLPNIKQTIFWPYPHLLAAPQPPYEKLYSKAQPHTCDNLQFAPDLYP